MRQGLLIGSVVAVALLLTWLAWIELRYLHQDHSVKISWPGKPTYVHHVEFPSWMMAVHGLLWLAAMAATIAFLLAQTWAPTVAWTTFAITLVSSIYYIAQYGTMGSPTSKWTVLLLLILALITTYGRRFSQSVT